VNLEIYFRRNHPEWPTPDSFFSTLFTLTESIEFLEAFYLRKDDRYIRTNDKQSDETRELTQVAMMLSTALIQESKGTSLPNLSQDQALILLHVLNIIDNLTSSLHTHIIEGQKAQNPESLPTTTSLIQAFESCLWIADKMHIDLGDKLIDEHFRIEEKIKENTE